MSLPSKLAIPAWAVPVAFGVMLSALDGYIARLVGTSLLLVVAVQAFPKLVDAYPFLRRTVTFKTREFDLESWARRVVPPLTLLLLTAFLYWRPLLGQAPRSRDHMVHLARAWLFSHELLGQGRLTGWSSFWFAGYPAGQLYPPGTDIWVTFFRTLHLGIPDWSVSYAHAFLAFSLLAALTLYWLGLRASGSRLVGFLTGLFWLLDPGAWREGGWENTVHWAVWSQVLGLVFAVLALCALDRLLERPSGRWAALTALAIGFSLLSHPMSLMTFGIMIPSYLVCRWLVGPWPKWGLGLSGGAGLLGFALALWWLLPFIDRGEWSFKIPALWRSMDLAAEGLVSGAPFENHWPFVGVLAVLGVIHTVRQRRPLMLGLLIFTVSLLFLSTITALEELRLEEISPAFGRIIYQRFSISAKVGWFVLAAQGAVAFVEATTSQAARNSGETVPSIAKGLALTSLVCLCCAPFVLDGAPAMRRVFLAGVGDIEVAAQQEDYADYRQFLHWSRELRESSDEFYRIGYVELPGVHFFADAPVYNHTPAYRATFTPCTTFVHRPESEHPEVLRALSVRYVVSRGPLQEEHLTPERAFGAIRVYRLIEPRMERYTLEGPGRAEVLQFDEETIRIQVSGATEETRLTLHVANYVDWSASLNGEPIETIRSTPIHDEMLRMFMQVDVPRDGVVELRFTRPSLRVGMQIVSLAALALTLLMLFAHRFRWWARLLSVLAPAVPLAGRGVQIAAAAGTLVIVGIVLYWLGGGGRTPSTEFSYSFHANLSQAAASIRREGATTDCRRRGNKLICAEHDWAFVGSKRLVVEVADDPCIWAHPYSDGDLTITFQDVPLDKALGGGHALEDRAVTRTPDGADVRLVVSVEEGPTQAFVAPNVTGRRSWRLDTANLAGQHRDVTFTISTENAVRRHYCFDGGVLAAEPDGASTPTE